MRKLLLLAAALAATLAAPQARAARASYVGYVVDQSVAADPRRAQTFSTPAGETGEIDLALQHADGTAYDLAGAQVALSVNRGPTVVLSRQATIDDAAAGLAHFPLVVADTLSLRGGMTFDIWVTDASGSRWQAIPPSSFAVTPALGQPNQPVTVPASQQPLAQGPTGPTGATGATGAAGPQGPSGTSGTLTASAPLTGGGLMSSNVSIGVDSTVAHCSATTVGDYCGWNGTAWTREPAPTASTGNVVFSGNNEDLVAPGALGLGTTNTTRLSLLNGSSLVAPITSGVQYKPASGASLIEMRALNDMRLVSGGGTSILFNYNVGLAIEFMANSLDQVILGDGYMRPAQDSYLALGAASFRYKYALVGAAATAQPTCNATTRGATMTVFAAAGVGDALQICMKGTTDTYAWKTVFTAP